MRHYLDENGVEVMWERQHRHKVWGCRYKDKTFTVTSSNTPNGDEGDTIRAFIRDIRKHIGDQS